MKKYRIYKYFDDCDATIYGTYDSKEKAEERYNELCRNNRTIYTSYRLKEIEVPDNIKDKKK